MKQLINLLLLVWKQIGNCEDGMEETINSAIMKLINNYCREELNLKYYYPVFETKLYNGVVGRYNSKYGEIEMDSKVLKYVEYAIEGRHNAVVISIDAMLHEFRHAWQFEGNMEIPSDYVNGSEDMLAYMEQPIEIDARQWAKNNVEDACLYIANNLIDELIK